MKIKIFRYEMEDGGGPFFTPDGQARHDKNIKFESDFLLSGCLSKKELEQWFFERGIDASNYILKEYSIDSNKIIFNKTHILFQKE